MLQIKNIAKDYVVSSDLVVHALKNVSVNFRQSEFVSILGPSGCGKTTLLNIIGGLDRYTDGDLVINGVSTSRYRDSDWDAYRNHSIGFVFQSYNLIPHMSILDNVTLSLTLSGASKAERIAKAQAALVKVGLAAQMKKRPNQLSGGQMQRVAIARAIVNDPDIILADEPTGALDSETSVQIMDILKDIAKERLVVMVTHNRELAEQYSTRIVSLLDGEIVSDTNPFDGTEEPKQTEITATEQNIANTQPSAQSDCNGTSNGKSSTPKRKKRVGMSFFTALFLSFRNLLSKKGRTILTSFAGSIGIFGVALVLATSAGMTEYVNGMQQQAMGDSSITISASAYDVDKLMSGDAFVNNLKPYPTGTTGVTPYSNTAAIPMISNNLSQEYVDYLKEMDSKLYKSLDFDYALSFNAFTKGDNGNYTRLANFGSDIPMSSKAVSKLPAMQMVRDNYEVLAAADGTSGYPQQYTDVVLVVDKYNRIDVRLLGYLGFDSVAEGDDGYRDISYADIVGKTYTLLSNNDYYKLDSETDTYKTVADQAEINTLCQGSNAVTVRIVGVLRRKNDDATSLLNNGLNYTSELADKLYADSYDSDVAKAQRANSSTDVLTGRPIVSGYGTTAEEEYIAKLKKLGGYSQPSSIAVYPVDGSAKSEILDYLDAWNDDHDSTPDDKVVYTDLQGIAVTMMSNMINVTTWVLVAFSAVSLLVSAVMIAVTTYTSVIERTKEIGVLRSLGASKHDISGIFNAETSLIGALAGVIGLVFAVIVGVILNIVLANLFEVTNIVLFTPQVIIGMLALSIVLTLVAGLIPAGIAANKDPVTCLRSE